MTAPAADGELDLAGKFGFDVEAEDLDIHDCQIDGHDWIYCIDPANGREWMRCDECGAAWADVTSW